MKQKRPCACEGRTLDRLLQPTVMAILARGPRHGYALVAELSGSPLMKGVKHNDTGAYRLLGVLEEPGLVPHHIRASHDLWHVLTGYHRDYLGELQLLAFSYYQTGSPAYKWITRLRESEPGARSRKREDCSTLPEKGGGKRAG